MSGDNVDDVNAIGNGGKINFHDCSKSLILPTDFVFSEILPRLPVKTLIRFKSVSKSWHSCINSSKFKRTHLNLYSPSAHQFILSNLFAFKFWLLPFDELNNLKNPVEIDISDDFCFDKEPGLIDIVGVCNGLVCLLTSYEGYMVMNGNDKYPTLYHFFSIWNPALHKYCEIANPDSLKFVSTHWFGYIASTSIDDYKIIAVFSSTEFANDEEYYVYSLRSKTWKLVSDLYRFVPRCVHLSSNTTVVNDILYWSPYCMYKNQPKYIVGLNLVTEQVKQYPSMDWLSPYVYTHFFVMNGCLSLYCYGQLDDNPVSDVWSLKRHDDWSSWEKSFSVHNHNGGLLCVAPTRKFLVLHPEEEQCSYKFELIGASKDGQEQSQGDACYVAENLVGHGGGFYVESLIWPF